MISRNGIDSFEKKDSGYEKNYADWTIKKALVAQLVSTVLFSNILAGTSQ